MELYLVRHGETDWNRCERLQGQRDIPLNAYGRELAERTGRGLQDVPFDAVFSSPLRRALETAELIRGSRPLEIRTDRRLMEISFGVLEGERIPEIMENPSDPLYNFYEHPGQYLPPEGAESYGDLFRRGESFMETVLKPLEAQLQTALVVSHGGLIRSIINPLLGIPLADFWKAEMGNCAVFVLRLEQGRFSVVEKNRVYGFEKQDGGIG